MATEAGVRELKARLSAYLRRVKAGETVIVTDRGTPVARIVPAGEPIAERIEGMIDAGLVAWSGAGLDPAVPVARTRGERSVSEILLEGRD